MPDGGGAGQSDTVGSDQAVAMVPLGEFIYRAEILRELERHGVRPLSRTRPALVRGFVRELYKFEIRRLKDQMRRQAFARTEYAARVEALRRQYPVLALMPEQFVERAGPKRPGEQVDGHD